MASASGYDGATTPVVSFFNKEQRARLEALTFAKSLTRNGLPNVHLHEWLRIADYIIKGD